ncbi:hypothetical protein OTB20_19020 [Streptomyces sp. H27-H1]|uniref:hypothetical protein n=1 Tax=Streptomyces sp. H27-H1 TaxID=2996461 RepID=UPI00226FCE09|nr:hypothetical protein [Streptomyces sp. H27-H1]MCY0928250.1 hypothetical protein [Streptomyces sp. H27-H1]
MKWLDEAVATGDAHTPAHPSRIAVLNAVRADRSSPEAVRLLRLARSADSAVRLGAFDLLLSLVHDGPWPEAGRAALRGLCDPEEPVRRLAARLLVYAGQRERALRALAELTDPVVRTVLAECLGDDIAPLCDDPLAAVRFLAHLAALKAAPATRRPDLDAALLADAREAGAHLADIGERWGWVLSRLGRDQHAYEVVAHLLADRQTRDIGAGLARAACHAWRAAPAELLPLLVRHRGRELGPAMAAALTTASISEQALSTHGDLLAAIEFTPYPRARAPWRDRAPSYDAAAAAELLAARPVGIGRLGRAPEIFGALLDEGPLTFRQAAQLYGLTFERPGRMQGVCAPLWLRHAGPSALPRLLAFMTPCLGDYVIGEFYLEGLARMGGHALPALPAVTAMIERRTRIPANDSTPDGEMWLDERLLKAALEARDAILEDGGETTRTPAHLVAEALVRGVAAGQASLLG